MRADIRRNRLSGNRQNGIDSQGAIPLIPRLVEDVHLSLRVVDNEVVDSPRGINNFAAFGPARDVSMESSILDNRIRDCKVHAIRAVGAATSGFPAIRNVLRTIISGNSIETSGQPCVIVQGAAFEAPRPMAVSHAGAAADDCSRFGERDQADELTGNEVEQFLIEHPHFIKQRDDLLVKLEIPHRLNGATSLIEYQVRRLRVQLAKLQKQTDAMIENGRNNENLEKRVHQLTLAMLRCHRLPKLFATLYSTLRQQFEIDSAAVRLMYSPRRSTNVKLAELSTPKETLVEFFSEALISPKTLYGNLTEKQCEVLFSSDKTLMDFAINTGSCTVIPLMADKPVGLLVLISTDANRFREIRSSHYLLHLGENIAAVLRRWLDYGDSDA